MAQRPSRGTVVQLPIEVSPSVGGPALPSSSSQSVNSAPPRGAWLVASSFSTTNLEVARGSRKVRTGSVVPALSASIVIVLENGFAGRS